MEGEKEGEGGGRGEGSRRGKGKTSDRFDNKQAGLKKVSVGPDCPYHAPDTRCMEVIQYSLPCMCGTQFRTYLICL